MSDNFELKAISNDVEIGKNGLRIKSDGDRLIIRKNDDTDFGYVQTALAESTYHAVPKSQYDAMRNVLIFREYADVEYSDSSPINIGPPIEANSTIFKVIVNVDTAFNDTDCTLEIGVGSSATNLHTVDSSNLQQTGIYLSYEYHTTGNEKEQIYATLDNGSATVGHCSVVVLYYET